MFLDPRFKALVFMVDSDKSCTIASVKEEAQIQNDDSTSSNTSTSTVNLSDDDDASLSPKKAKKGLMYLLDDAVSSKAQDDDVALLSDRH